jgi:hypothetical protein
MSADAMIWKVRQSAGDLVFPGLLIETSGLVRLADLGADAYQSAREMIGCNLIEKVTVEGAGRISADFLFDEEGGPAIRSDAEFNEVATSLGHALRLAQACGSYPAPADLGFADLDAMARSGQHRIRLYGPVVVVGADEGTGNWVPVPSRLVEFVADELGIEVAA